MVARHCTLGKSSDYLGNGWTIGGGVTYQRKPQSRLALQVDLAYADFNATYNLVNLGQQKVQYSIDGGTGKCLVADGGRQVHACRSAQRQRLRAAGHRRLSRVPAIDRASALGGVVCDPWGLLLPRLHDRRIVVASKSLTKLGWDFGLGLEFPLKGGSAWYLETRYHHVQGTKSVEYLPIQVGYRF